MTEDGRKAIRERARALGFDACRFTTARPPDHAAEFHRWLDAGCHGEMGYLQRTARKRMAPALVLADARTIITLAVSYHIERAPTAQSGTTGQIARYAQFSDYHHMIGERLKSLVQFIDQTDPGGSRSLWYVDTGPLLERDLAQRAGLGFIGKHASLINRKLGNWIFLAEIITTLEIEPDVPERNHCGSCRRCLDACPTAAITAPFQLDARRCISYLTIELKGPIPEEFRPAIGTRIYGCDDCLAVCPWNRFAREGALMRPHYRAELAAPDLVELLSLDEAGFKRRFAGTPILRAKRRGFLRNVCVALGNCSDSSALPALARAAGDGDPLIAEHARWAIKRLEENDECRSSNDQSMIQ
ncbi:MAG: tRNA epoxyqueuosine(34) reductase QueG [Limisphaerales bacterium]